MKTRAQDHLTKILVAAAYWLEQEENFSCEESAKEMEEAVAWAEKTQLSYGLRSGKKERKP